MQEYLDAVSVDLIITEIGILVAGFAAVLGIWLERDHSKPPRYAWWLSLLIVLCTFVGMFQTLADAKEGAKLESDMARMLATLDKIAQSSEVEIPALNEFVKSEVSAQARANPDVVKKVAQRVADEGGDPAEMLGSYLPPSEVESVARKGALTTRAAKVKKDAPAAGGAGDAPAEKPKRRKLEFGGKPKVREPDSGKPEKSDKKDDDDRPRIGGGRDRDDKDDKDDKKGKDDKDDKKDKDDKPTIGGRDKDDKKGDKKDDKKDDKPSIGGPKGPAGGAGGVKPPGGGAPAPGRPKPGLGR
jgi:hypothetical protein